MKRQVLSPYARSLIHSIQIRLSLAGLFRKRKPAAIAKILAKTLNELSRLYAENPRAPRHVPLYPFCGIPVLNIVSKNTSVALEYFTYCNLTNPPKE